MMGTFMGYSGRQGNKLKMTVDIEVVKPVFTGFFLDREGCLPLWIQCKFENLGRICFKYGRLEHSSESCRHRELVKVVASHSPEVDMLGPWIHDESSSKLFFDGLESFVGRGKFHEAVAWLKVPENDGVIPAPMANRWLMSLEICTEERDSLSPMVQSTPLSTLNILGAGEKLKFAALPSGSKVFSEPRGSHGLGFKRMTLKGGEGIRDIINEEREVRVEIQSHEV